MSEPRVPETTRLLREWAKGDQAALVRLTPRIYRELRRMAGHFMKNESPGRTIQATALVHEAWLKLVDVDNVEWQHRAHFFAVAAQVMRNILLDAARRRATGRRGGDAKRLTLGEIPDIGAERGDRLIALDDALTQLTEVDPRRARVVELRFFGGLTTEEIAAVLNVSTDTVLRDWKLARAWLLVQMNS